MTPRPTRHGLPRLGTAGLVGTAVAGPLAFGVAVGRLGALYPQTPLEWLLPVTGAVLALAPLVVVGRELRRRPVR
jgi:uncharacterized membrane protein YdcZ (DUF606 family)